MPKLTQAQLKKLLVEERKKSRIKQKNSAFLHRTRGIYSGQQNRLGKSLGRSRGKLPYSLDDLRTLCLTALEHPCAYCGEKLTVKTMCPDHKTALAKGGTWSLKNLAIVHANCNFRKGQLSSQEYRLLVKFTRKYLSKDSTTDLWRRLTIGGRWSK